MFFDAGPYLFWLIVSKKLPANPGNNPFWDRNGPNHKLLHPLLLLSSNHDKFITKLTLNSPLWYMFTPLISINEKDYRRFGAVTITEWVLFKQ